MQLIQLDIVGLSYSQTQTGAYALVLGELTGNRRLPIIIGSFEAKAIAVALESEIKPERPITHDLFTTFCKGYDVRVQKVVISSIRDGIFSSIVYCVDNDGKELELDARTSDAVAIAVRFNAPIFTYQVIMEDAGIILDKDITPSIETKKVSFPEIESEFASLSLNELEEALHKAVSEEDYERASKIRDEINKRQ
ncbi:MAG: hypothetical protein CMP66_06830 [Flavobacteriales bacterium]|nr:hypothetical protein [Flavobacteriales bacterium]|tara:strand:+ start:33069 stop:33653 length:585 start_codon:yes stop_codon:yes gene_type:complete